MKGTEDEGFGRSVGKLVMDFLDRGRKGKRERGRKRREASTPNLGIRWVNVGAFVRTRTMEVDVFLLFLAPGQCADCIGSLDLHMNRHGIGFLLG